MQLYSYANKLTGSAISRYLYKISVVGRWDLFLGSEGVTIDCVPPVAVGLTAETLNVLTARARTNILIIVENWII